MAVRSGQNFRNRSGQSFRNPQGADSHVEDRTVKGPNVATKADAALALKTLGYPPVVARAAVERGCARLDGACDLEALIRAALQSVRQGG